MAVKARARSWEYTDTSIVKRFKELFSNIANIYIGKWYYIGECRYIYENEKGYYHLVVLYKLSSNKVDIKDYVCSRNGELVYCKSYGYFIMSSNELNDFLNDKVK